MCCKEAAVDKQAVLGQPVDGKGPGQGKQLGPFPVSPDKFILICKR